MAGAKKSAGVTVTRSSAFHAIGLGDADDLVLRADLMKAVAQVIRAKGLTQAAAGRVLDMEQPRVSALMNGKLSLFSSERLIEALRDLNQDVRIRVTPAKSARGRVLVET